MPAEKVSLILMGRRDLLFIYCQTGQRTAMCMGLAALKHAGVGKIRDEGGKAYEGSRL